MCVVWISVSALIARMQMQMQKQKVHGLQVDRVCRKHRSCCCFQIVLCLPGEDVSNEANGTKGDKEVV